jgi:uncharacterized RDD family membrane protein YckC
MSVAAGPRPDLGPAPGLVRRMAAFVYEGVLLFGVLFVATWLFSGLTQQRHALQGRHGLLAFLTIVLALYFVFFWSRGGQTVAMRAWHLRVVTEGGGALSQTRALARFVAAWAWFAPALLAAWLAGLHSVPAIFALLGTGVVAYALLALAHPQRQFWHDALCGTRLIHWQPRKPTASAESAA